MTYILLIWTVVACSNDLQYCKYDWRPIGEFHTSSQGDAQKLCEAAATQLVLKAPNYRCVRSK